MQEEFAYREYEKRLLKHIAVRIRELRVKAGVTQKFFFAQTNIHIGRIETGKVNISISTLSRICSYFGITIHEFFKGIPGEQ